MVKPLRNMHEKCTNTIWFAHTVMLYSQQMCAIGNRQTKFVSLLCIRLKLALCPCTLHSRYQSKPLSSQLLSCSCWQSSFFRFIFEQSESSPLFHRIQQTFTRPQLIPLQLRDKVSVGTDGQLQLKKVISTCRPLAALSQTKCCCCWLGYSTVNKNSLSLFLSRGLMHSYFDFDRVF